MKRLLLGLLFSTGIICTQAQVIATNFTTTDCNNVTHNLFSELDNGKVIVLVWVMPCPACITGGKTAYNVVQSYASAYPGKVLYYLFDNLGDNDCSTMESWAFANGIDATKISIFSNNNNVADQMNYGGLGMPHTVVLGGGTGHKIYFNGINNDADNAAAIQGAINVAMFPAAIATVNTNLKTNLFPNPATGDRLTVQYNMSHAGNASIDIVNVIGKKVVSSSKYVSAGNNKEEVNIGGLPNGVYFLKLNGEEKTETIRFTINK